MKFTLLITLLFSLNAFAETDLDREKRLSAEYLVQMAQEPNAEVYDKGVVLRPIFDSKRDEHAKPDDNVIVTYQLSDRLGAVLEESISNDIVNVFPLSRLIKCWKIAIPQMAFGSFYKITCPSETAYGDKGAGDGLIKPGAALTFRVFLHGVK